MKKVILLFIVLLSLVSCSRKTMSVERELRDTVRIEHFDTLYLSKEISVCDTVYLSDTIYISEVIKTTLDAEGKVIRTDTEREKSKISNRNASHVINAQQARQQTSVAKNRETIREKENKVVKEKPPILQRIKDNIYFFAVVLLIIIGAYYYFVYSKRSKKGE